MIKTRRYKRPVFGFVFCTWNWYDFWRWSGDLPCSILFFPSCASVALARSSHIVVLMNELSRCNYYVPHWGVESGVGTITQSEVKSGPKHRENQETKKQQKPHKNRKPTKKQKQRREPWPDNSNGGWPMMPLNYEILHRSKHKTPEQKARSCEGVQQNNPLSSAETQDPPCQDPGDRAEKPSRHKTSSQWKAAMQWIEGNTSVGTLPCEAPQQA